MTSLRTRLLAAVLLCVATSVIACESASSISSSGGFVPPTPPGSPGLPPGMPPPPTARGLEAPCPGYDPPTVGTDCSGAFLDSVETCEYGHDLDGTCNDIFECVSNRWHMRSRPDCFGRCPADFADIVPGAPCADSTVGCSYLEGTCACVAAPGTTDGGSGDADADAGAGPVPGTWRCAPPPGAGCPPQRPSLGSNCVRAMTCDYGACALGRDVVYACDPGARRWLQADYPDCD